MHIVLLGDYPPFPGGISSHVFELSKQLSLNEYEITVITFRGEKKNEYREDNIHIYQEPSRLKLKFIRKVIKLLSIRKNVDIYHAHGIFNALACFIANKRPLVVTIHGYASLELVSNGKIKSSSIAFKLIRFLEEAVVEKCDALITVGPNLKTWIIDELGTKNKNIYYVPNGVNAVRINNLCKNNRALSSDIKNKLELNQKRVILFTKSFTLQNGILTLIESLPRILSRHEDAYLVAVGGGPLKEEAISLAKRLNLISYISFVDNVPHDAVSAYLNIAEIYAVPFIPLFTSKTEVAGVGDTLGIAHLEAMAVGLPVIGTAIGDLNKFELEMNNSLIYVPPNDSERLADAINLLLDDPLVAKQMGNRAKKLIFEKYTWEKVAIQTSNIYRLVLTNK